MKTLPLAMALGACRRFRRNRRGSVAIEFAMIAPIFFGLLFAIIESALMFFAGQVLETAIQDSARLILTGQVQNSGQKSNFTKDQFKEEVCNRLVAMFNCSGLYVDVQSFPNGFGSVTITNPIDANKNFVDNTRYDTFQANSIVVVRGFYQWQLFVTGLGFNVANLAGNKRLLSATAAFQNEPY